jgi:hypothetical protein
MKITNLGKKDLKFSFGEPPTNACPTTVSERKGNERMDLLPVGHRTAVGLEPSFGQELFRCGEVLFDVTDY